MSNATYNKLWQTTTQQLIDQMEYETPKDTALVPKDRESAFHHVATLYLKYIQIYRNFEETYDQIVHPQKRRLLKDVVVAILGRILELRHKMVEIEFSDFHNFSDTLLDLKLVPNDLSVLIPRFYMEERGKQIEAQRTLLESLNAKQLGDDEKVPLFPVMNLVDAIRTIQINERGRQGQLRAKYMRDIKLQAQREKELDGADDENQVNKAALKIQKVRPEWRQMVYNGVSFIFSYRGFKGRKYAKKLSSSPTPPKHMFDEGMQRPSAKDKDPKTNPITKAETNRQRRKVVQQTHEEEYQHALVNTKEKIMKVEGPDMKETMQDTFRQWYMEFKRIHGKYPFRLN
ncbi:Dynein regulatory complex protein 11 [Quaeritorhiza haematococci]|nr:Dynein regulatory complex protein 11 [Quaeritorhiza haematococci]